MEREVGGGIGMGNTCKSMADSCQCMTKTTTIKKKCKKKKSDENVLKVTVLMVVTSVNILKTSELYT